VRSLLLSLLNVVSTILEMQTKSSSQIAYSKFVSQVQAAQVDQVTIKSRLLEYCLKEEFGGQCYRTHKTGSQSALINLLQSHGVKFDTINDDARDNGDTTASLITLLLSSGLLVGALAWLAKFSTDNGGMGVGFRGRQK
jgi:cell division protease FtsH